MKSGSLLSLVLAATVSTAQIQQTSPNISYEGGQLKIDVVNTTLTNVLTQVAALIGVKFDIPPDATSDVMPVVKFGPGPPREVLAALLSGSHFDYLIQASDADPNKIQSVLLTTAEKKGTAINVDPPARSPYSRLAEQAHRTEDAVVSVDSAPASAEQAGGDTASSSQTTSPQPDQPSVLAGAQSDQPSLRRPGALSPPDVLNQQRINAQLQQMYQQRAQIIQQSRQPANQ